MLSSPRLHLFFAGIMGAMGVALGAYASHGTLTSYAAQKIRLAGDYSLFHAAAVVGLIALRSTKPLSGAALGLCSLFLILGTLTFSGSIAAHYLFSYATGLAQWGGHLLLLGWSTLILTGLFNKRILQ